MKEEVSEREALLVKMLFDKEIEFLKQYLPGKKEQQNEAAYIFALSSWGEMFGNKIKAAISPDKNFSKDYITRFIESYYF